MNLGKLLVYVGLGLAAAGLLVILGSKLGLPRLGRLPGDIVYKGKNGTFYFPIVTCIVVSILLSLIVSIFRR
jgi:hypothetical protein